MPHDAVRLVNATPSSTPRTKAQVNIFAVCRREESIKTSQLKELLSINSHEATRREEGMACVLLLCGEFPSIKAVSKLQAGWSAGDLGSVPIVAPRRNRK